MAYILFTTSERAKLEALVLPEGSTLVQSSKNGKTMYRFVVEGGKWRLECDFVENDRGWKRGEEKNFLKGVDRERVVDFFLSQDEGDSVPQREYSAMCDVECNLLKFIKHAGSYLTDKKTGQQMNLFDISLNEDSDIDAAEEEISWCLAKIAKAYPGWKPIYIGIFEHTLSAGGIYSLNWDGKNNFELNKCTYGRDETLKKFSDLRSTLEYIAKNHYYQ